MIHGGRPLEGEICASGSKNAVLPMIAAAMLTDEEVVLENVPSIRDVDVMLEIAALQAKHEDFAGAEDIRPLYMREADTAINWSSFREDHAWPGEAE